MEKKSVDNPFGGLGVGVGDSGDTVEALKRGFVVGEGVRGREAKRGEVDSVDVKVEVVSDLGFVVRSLSSLADMLRREVVESVRVGVSDEERLRGGAIVGGLRVAEDVIRRIAKSNKIDLSVKGDKAHDSNWEREWLRDTLYGRGIDKEENSNKIDKKGARGSAGNY